MVEQLPRVELIWQDESGSTSQVSLPLPIGTTYDEADASASALASVLASLTDSVLVRQRIEYKKQSETRATPVSGSTVKRQGALFFTTGDDTSDVIVLIPGIKSDVFQTDGPCAGYCIDLSNTDIVDFSAELISIGVSNPFADVITALVSGYLQSRV